MLLENENYLDSIQRHLEEMEDDLEGWNRELNRNKTQGNEKYKNYCKTCISICKNTIEKLLKEKKDIMEA